MKCKDFEIDTNTAAEYTRDFRELEAQLARMEKTQRELRQERDRAEDNAKAKSIFLANMSHEIRTPMNAIIGMTAIAKESTDPERISYCLEKIDDAATHLLGIINDILDMSKIDAGKFTFSPIEFVLDDMLQQIISVTGGRASDKQQHLIFHIDDSVPDSLITDQQRLTQVITNLLSNAVKFTPDGGTIRVNIDQDDLNDNNFQLRVSVTDTGIGIDKEQQRKLFHSFEQADGSISRRFGGTGLGLAISKNIIEMLGGSINVSSKPGHGSCFYFTVPVSIGQKLQPVKLNPHFNKQNSQVMLVGSPGEETDPLRMCLNGLGFECTDIDSSDQTINYVIIDWELSKQIIHDLLYKLSSLPTLPVIIPLLSSSQQPIDEDLAKRYHLHHFLTKPILKSAVVNCFNALLQPHTAALGNTKDHEIDNIFTDRRILLAEDVAINREILIKLLFRTGIQIDCAEDGRQAVEMFTADQDHYDLILMDIHMPQLDGYQATRKIRELDTTAAANIPIIAMTANVFREDIEKCLDSGMNDHLGKPINVGAVIQKLKDYLVTPPS